MQYRKLGNTDLEVSVICLGTMTFGEQNTQAEAFEQMDYALQQGVNFFDTAELYSIPPKAQTYGSTETIIGHWLKQSGHRDKIVLASKIAGPGPGWVDHIRGGHSKFDRANITQALDDSLKRLQTDYLDLYQLHWPERKTQVFDTLAYDEEPENFTPIEETLGVLGEMVEAGKIRHIGLSNETPWGTMRFLQVARDMNLPVMVSVQNPYSLLNRTYEVGMAEVSIREHCGLLAYSPLGFGVLSGKYLGGKLPEGSRLALWPNYARYSSPSAIRATEKYAALAQQHGLSLAQMALAFVNTRRFLTSNIIGATTLEQLSENIASIDVELPEAVLEGIEIIHREISNPSP